MILVIINLFVNYLIDKNGFFEKNKKIIGIRNFDLGEDWFFFQKKVKPNFRNYLCNDFLRVTTFNFVFFKFAFNFLFFFFLLLITYKNYEIHEAW